jgi:hypothetical protein
MLTVFAVGAPHRSQHIAIAAHLIRCAHCRGWMRSMETCRRYRIGEAAPHGNVTNMKRSARDYRREDPDAKDPEPGDTPAEAIAALGGIAS